MAYRLRIAVSPSLARTSSTLSFLFLALLVSMPQQLQCTFGLGVSVSRQGNAVETVLAVQPSGVNAALNGKNSPKAGSSEYSMATHSIGKNNLMNVSGNLIILISLLNF